MTSTRSMCGEGRQPGRQALSISSNEGGGRNNKRGTACDHAREATRTTVLFHLSFVFLPAGPSNDFRSYAPIAWIGSLLVRRPWNRTIQLQRASVDARMTSFGLAVIIFSWTSTTHLKKSKSLSMGGCGGRRCGSLPTLHHVYKNSRPQVKSGNHTCHACQLGKHVRFAISTCLPFPHVLSMDLACSQ